MRKKTSLIIFAGIFLFLILGFVSSAEICCKKTLDGGICKEVEESECDGTGPPTSCEQTTFCKLGTCVDEATGECKSQSYYWKCIEDGGQWYAEPADQVPQCQEGCCYLGQNAFPTTAVECKQLAHDYVIETTFDSTITDENVCIGSSGLDPEGACVYEDNYGLLTCSRKLKSACETDPDNSFNPNYLCTHPSLGNLCFKTEETMLYDDYRVYFLDSCGNRANIYDYQKRNDASYWLTIIQPQDSCGHNEFLSADAKRFCGNCDPTYNTIGKNINDASFKSNSRNSEPVIGEYACADMGCVYDTDGDGEIEDKINGADGVEYYKHGDSWCAMAPGNYFVNSSNKDKKDFHGILINSTSGEYSNVHNADKDMLKELIMNYEKYNTPGTEYYVLKCVDGEVVQSNCGTLRTEICVEYWWGENDESRSAGCISNQYKDCIGKTNFNSCENSTQNLQMCKWVEGFRWDDAITNTNEQISTETQGSCVPLFPPGFMFWTDDSNDPDGNDLNGIETCGKAGFTKATTYYVNWLNSRDEFDDRPTCDTTGIDKNKDLTGSCGDNCYLIPEYGRDNENSFENLFEPFPEYPRSIYAGIYNSELYRAHAGYDGALTPRFESYCVSDQRQYYCVGASGHVGGSDVDCARDAGNRKNFPVFFTHNTFLDSIRERARSLGDCGYKENTITSGVSNPSTELMKVYFQKLKNNGDPKGEEGEKVLYTGETIDWGAI